MGKHLLLFTAACMVMSAILAGCGVGHKAVSQDKSAAKTTVDPKVRDSIYLAHHPRQVIGKDWTPLKQSQPVLLAGLNPDLSAFEYKISLPDVLAMKRDKPRQGKKPTVVSRKIQTKNDKSGSTQAENADVALTGAPDVVKPSDAATPETGKADTAENLAGNSKTDTVEPAAVAITKPLLSAIIENNPSPLVEGGDETPDPKPLSGAEMDALVGKYAVLISVEPKEITNYSLYRFIDDWYGTEYKWGGEDNSGIDCSALTQKLYEEVYHVDIERTARKQYHTCERIKNATEASQGDLVFFRVHHIRISHVGVYLANGYFVHASSSQGVVISNLKSKYWRRRFAGCGRILNDDLDTESENLP